MKFKKVRIKLKPCPFCGREPDSIDREVRAWAYAHRLECAQCGANGPSQGSINKKSKPTNTYQGWKQVLEAWNRRAYETSNQTSGKNKKQKLKLPGGKT